uniref:Myb-like domain-containing protein n=1 Tax=Lactuca sativa TaxID=4236 RepID=A0A9R1WC17_LACSA|nr:hypothetical protein LSAT_V11C200086000 [Lactuca sativa]
MDSQPPLSPDFVPETQPSPPPQPKKKKGKKPARPTTNQERVPWTKEEEEKLAEAWVAASEDPIVGDSQTYESFWEKVRAIFYELMESQARNADQITSKWRDIRLKCTDFGGIYNNLLNIRKNGSNDFDVFKAAMDQYEKTTPTRKAFPYMKPWLKLKDSPKWKEQTEGSSQSSDSKRSRNPDGTFQQSDGRTHIDINDDPIDLETDQPLPRPVGRNKAKKNGLQETKAEVMTRMEQKMIEAQTSFQEAQETLQTKTDMEILKMKADDLEGENLELFLAMKESVRARRRRRGSLFYVWSRVLSWPDVGYGPKQSLYELCCKANVSFDSIPNGRKFMHALFVCVFWYLRKAMNGLFTKSKTQEVRASEGGRLSIRSLYVEEIRSGIFCFRFDYVAFLSHF